MLTSTTTMTVIILGEGQRKSRPKQNKSVSRIGDMYKQLQPYTGTPMVIFVNLSKLNYRNLNSGKFLNRDGARGITL